MSPIRPPPGSGEHRVVIPRPSRAPVVPRRSDSGTLDAVTQEQIREAQKGRHERETMIPCPRCGGKGTVPQ